MDLIARLETRWWLRGNPDQRTIDLAYATTGHKAQGITRDEVLVRVTSAEDRQWLYVGGSRGIGETTFYSVITPEPAVRQDRERRWWTCRPPSALPSSRPTSSPPSLAAMAANSSPPPPADQSTRAA